MAEGPDEPAEEFVAEVYGALKKMANARLARLPPGASIQATGLVHDVFLRLRSQDRWQERHEFFGMAAVAMRDLMVERARAKATLRRGGGLVRLGESAVAQLATEDASYDGILELNEALQVLEREYPRKARIVLLRYFSGLSNQAVAEVLEVSPSTVERDWRFARAWLHERLTSDS